MKICFLLPQNVIGGGPLVVYEHARHFKKCGHEVLIIYREYTQGRDNNLPTNFGLDFKAFDTLNIDSLTFDVIFATWWETFYDIFLFNSRYYFYLLQADESRFYEDKNSVSTKFCDLTYRFPSVGIITVSQWLRNKLVNQGHPHTRKAANGYDDKIFTPASRTQNLNGKLRVLIEGHGDTWFRRIDDCFQATNGIDGIEVWFISRGNFIDPSWRYDKLFKDLSQTEMAATYLLSDVLLKMSEIESFCLPNLEMMATGGTIITTDFTGHTEYAVNNQNSIVISIRDVEAARNAVLKLRDNRAILFALQGNALQTAQAMTWNIQTPKFEKALLELTEELSGHDYSPDRELILRLREIKLSVDLSEKTRIKLESDYQELFAQHHRNEYRLLRFIGRIFYKIPLLGAFVRSLFKSKVSSK